MLQILLASSNQHKIQEFRDMLGDLSDQIGIITPAQFKDFPELIENGSSFEENASLKAEQASSFADASAMADDSGLVVDALGGAPGIYSARYAGENATNEQRIAKLLDEMKGITDRRAKFVCVIALAYRGEVVATFRGEVSGRIAEAPSGNGGFGYDPVFIPDGYDKSFGELGESVKSEISHRARAFAAVCDFIRKELASMDEFEFV